MNVKGLVILVGIALLISSSLLFLGIGKKALAQGCDASTIQGTYIWGYKGKYQEGGVDIAVSFAGRETYDGQGGLQGINSGIDEDFVVHQNVSYSGSYVENADCTGSVNVVDDNGVESNFDIFIDQDTGNFYYTSVDQHYIYAGVSERAE